MTKAEAVKDIKEYIRDADKAISEDEEYIRGWKSAMLVALETISKMDSDVVQVTCMVDENKKSECVYADNYTNIGWRDWEREELAAQLFLQDIEEWHSGGTDQ